MGIVSGEMLVDGQYRDSSFQRKTGYVQQQDLHSPSSTVREALQFSAILRQPSRYSQQEKIAYVDTVIKLLDMEDYADAVIGVPGSGLNVEQRKRLTIGVEVVARPQLLLFLDEPTSGLDSQTSWSICNLMEKLTHSGQAILCTIHQPSSMLFQRFDRLLLLAKGGKTVYFGPIGKDSQVLMDYFERNGGPARSPGTNPAEHMLEVIGAAPRAHTDIDWYAVWRASPEYQEVQSQMARLSNISQEKTQTTTSAARDSSQFREFAAPFTTQLWQVTKRVFQHYWRDPSYILSKLILTAGAVSLHNSSPFQLIERLIISHIGTSYRFVRPGKREHHPWPSESAFWRLHVSNDLHPTFKPNQPLVLRAANLVRGSRATVKVLLLASVHICQPER